MSVGSVAAGAATRLVQVEMPSSVAVLVMALGMVLIAVGYHGPGALRFRVPWAAVPGHGGGGGGGSGAR